MVMLLKLFNYLDRYIVDDTFRIVAMDDLVNVVNYEEVLDFSSKEITIKHKNGEVCIKGSDLVVSKMIDDELIINGKIKSISY